MWPFTQIAALFRKKSMPPPVEVFTYATGEFLTDNERKKCLEETCPDCGTVDKFINGPKAGLALNFYCGNAECGSRFNAIFPLGIERISPRRPFAQRIPAQLPTETPYRG